MNKVSLSLTFDTSLSEEAVDVFLKDIESRLLSHSDFCNYSFKVDFECLNAKSRIRVFEVPIKDVLNNLHSGKKSFSFNGKNYVVKMNSQRYFMFKENSCCVCCGLKGTRMFLEYHPYDMTPHFNLYGEKDGQLVLMTKDHILAKALGGEDRHSNYQTMCSVCNNLKGHASLTLESLKLLRKFFDENRDKMTKKQIHYSLEKYKSKLKKKEKKLKKKNHNCVALSCDVACFLDNKGIIYSRHIYDKVNDKRVGCIKKGTVLEPILEYKGDIICSLGKNNSVKISKHNLVNL